MPKSTLAVLLLFLGCVSAFSQQPPRNPAGQAAAERNGSGTLRQIIPGPYVYSSTTEDQAIAAIRWPQYEKMQGYDTQRETAVRRLYQQLTGKLP